MEISEKRVNQQIRNFEKALQGYRYDEPLSRYLIRFFKDNRQMGSSDRRMTSRFCYNYFRLGNSLADYTIVERLAFAEYLCSAESDVVHVIKPELVSSLQAKLSSKLRKLRTDYGFNLNDVFPFINQLSKCLNIESFLESQFVQPDLFIRVRRGQESFVRSAFDKEGIGYEFLSNNSVRLPNGTNLQRFTKLDGHYEVQDLSSQHTLDFLSVDDDSKWWDACAASGGKALLFLDKFPKTNLLVSDIRLSILRNLDERFDKAGITAKYRKKVLDLSRPVDSLMKGEQFDGIIIDAPCSGSGTWGRTPEMIQQLDEQKLLTYRDLQKSIVTNALPYLKPGGQLLYITCSVYEAENEEMVQYLLNNFGLELINSELFEGYSNKADSMFAAHFKKCD